MGCNFSVEDNAAMAHQANGGRLPNPKTEEQPGINCTGVLNNMPVYHTKFEDVLGDYLEANFGYENLKDNMTVMHALLMGVHVYVFHPIPSRNYYTLVTMGLSGYRMPGSPHPSAERCELMCYVDPSWSGRGSGRELNRKEDAETEKDGTTNAFSENWPYEMLVRLCAWVVTEEKWIGVSHMVYPYAYDEWESGCPYQAAMLVPPVDESVEGGDEDSQFGTACFGGDEETIELLVVVPLTKPETALKTEVRFEGMVEFLEDGRLPTVCQRTRPDCTAAGAGPLPFSFDTAVGGVTDVRDGGGGTEVPSQPFSFSFDPAGGGGAGGAGGGGGGAGGDGGGGTIPDKPFSFSFGAGADGAAESGNGGTTFSFATGSAGSDEQ